MCLRLSSAETSNYTQAIFTADIFDVHLSWLNKKHKQVKSLMTWAPSSVWFKRPSVRDGTGTQTSQHQDPETEAAQFSRWSACDKSKYVQWRGFSSLTLWHLILSEQSVSASQHHYNSCWCRISLEEGDRALTGKLLQPFLPCLCLIGSSPNARNFVYTLRIKTVTF